MLLVPLVLLLLTRERGVENWLFGMRQSYCRIP